MNDVETVGIVKDLLPAPVGWKKTNGKVLLSLIASLKVERTSASTSSTVIAEEIRTFPISSISPSRARVFPRGNGMGLAFPNS